MRMTDEQMRQMAEEIALSFDLTGEATIEADGGVFQAEYRKGADIVCDETYYCTVSGAWCNITSLLYYSDDDLYKGEKVECDIEGIENIVCEMTNN